VLLLYGTPTNGATVSEMKKPGPPQNSSVASGNIDLSKRKPVKVGPNMVATIRSISIPMDDRKPDGRQVIIPTIGPKGEKWSNDKAIKEYLKPVSKGGGRHLGIAQNIPQAQKLAQRLHTFEAGRVSKKKP
jgi:hypothetical protein